MDIKLSLDPTVLTERLPSSVANQHQRHHMSIETYHEVLW